MAQVVAVTDVGPAEAMLFTEAISRGEWVVIAGDRIPVHRKGRTVNAPFLGEDAPLWGRLRNSQYSALVR